MCLGMFVHRIREPRYYIFCFAGRLCGDVEVFSEDAAVNVVVGAFDDELTLTLVPESSQSGLCKLG